MARLPLLDTNPILRHVLDDHPEHSPLSHALFAAIEGGIVSVRTTDTVLFEAAFTLERYYKVPRETIRATLLDLLQLTGIVLAGKRSYRRVFDLWVEQPRLSFADCYHAALIERLRLPAIISFDRGFDHLPGIRRIETPGT
jgi:predicted nucleic acid-binding protein